LATCSAVPLETVDSLRSESIQSSKSVRIDSTLPSSYRNSTTANPIQAPWTGDRVPSLSPRNASSSRRASSCPVNGTETSTPSESSMRTKAETTLAVFAATRIRAGLKTAAEEPADGFAGSLTQAVETTASKRTSEQCCPRSMLPWPNDQDQPPARSDRARYQFTALEADGRIGFRLAGRLDRVVRHLLAQRVAAS
jgi:hypothetical protein